jgi:hypothetical protein
MMTPIYNPYAQALSQKLVSEGIKNLYHWTCVENTPSIRQTLALCSKARLEEQGLWPSPKPGGNELSHDLDRHRDNWDKVCLNFSPYTPMCYHKKRESHLCFFVIKPEVATWEGVVFTNTNATSNDHERGIGLEGLTLVNFGAVKIAPRPWDRAGWVIPVQAEVLVPVEIPIDYVDHVAFVSIASLKEAERLWGTSQHPRFSVSPLLFADGPQSGSPIGFSFVDEIALTDSQITRENVQQGFKHQDKFVRGQTPKITVVAKIHATTGSVVKIILGPQYREITEEFPTTNDYFIWTDFDINQIPNSSCYFELLIDDIHTARLEFALQ